MQSIIGAFVNLVFTAYIFWLSKGNKTIKWLVVVQVVLFIVALLNEFLWKL